MDEMTTDPEQGPSRRPVPNFRRRDPPVPAPTYDKPGSLLNDYHNYNHNHFLFKEIMPPHILDDALGGVGNTPLIRLDKIASANGFKCNLCKPHGFQAFH